MNKARVALLKQARYLIECDQKSFICAAIEEVFRINPECHVVGRIMMAIIRVRLQGEYCLEDWLVAEGHVKSFVHFTGSNKEKLKRTRLAWIDSLIKEFNHRG